MMLLSGKSAIVYGGGGAIGSAVGSAFAREGARVFLAGRTSQPLADVATRIRDAGGAAEVAEVDALSREAVAAHAAAVAGAAGGIDIAFNAVSNDDLQGIPLTGMAYEDFMRPVTKSVTAHFTIATALAGHMRSRGSGVILAMAGGREAIPSLGGSHVAWSALAGLCRQLASELGPDGIRVAWILSPGSPDALGAGDGADPEADEVTLLGRRPTVDQVANVAAFLASDWAGTMTATEVNITAGAVID
ncbi:MAG TPA: SDR family oxidoreductase [Streptosporangiaceae bacterium]|jgi:NAD(P)-dependent dehydrogenase (short-subunit alcohol dehydrogenase family)|nr:SDR family oxidoreductase [Streptosporangiaceae bacterium]